MNEKPDEKILSEVMTYLAHRAVKKRHAGMTKAQKHDFYSALRNKRTAKNRVKST